MSIDTVTFYPVKRSREKIPNKPEGYSTTNIKRMICEHKQIQKWNGKIKKCLSKDVSDDMETKKCEFILTRWKKWLQYIACILFVHHTRINSCMMEEVAEIHTNDITGRPLSNIGCGPVSIGASAGAAGGAAAVSGTPDNVQHLLYVRKGVYKPYSAVRAGMAISNYIPV